MQKYCFPLALAALVCSLSQVFAADEPKGTEFKIAGLTFEAPAEFKVERPKSPIIEQEFSVPAAEGDERGGRLTVMTAGGTVAQNIERWIGQFNSPDGGAVKPKVEKKQAGRHEVHFVDLSGTFDDKPAPFAPGVAREGYRMLGAIIPGARGAVYFKFYGPKATMAAHEAAFRQMILDGIDES